MKAVLELIAGGLTAASAVPSQVHAHRIEGGIGPPLPLPLYLAAGALAVGTSFGLLAWRGAPNTRGDLRPSTTLPRRLTLLLRSVGMLAWIWVAAATVIDRPSASELESLVLWVYGWVGLAFVSALLGPAWAWLDPFATLHDIAAGVGQRLHVRPWRPRTYPTRLGAWPAVAGFAFFVWLELAADDPPLGAVMLGYTAFSLVAMATFGRDAWRAQGETFAVWFTLLGRLAPFALDGPPSARRVRRRPALTGLIEGAWSVPLIILTAIATGAILFDGLSQTALWRGQAGGSAAMPGVTFELGVWLGAVVAAALLASRSVGMAATGAGLLPIAVAYLLAHYLTFALADGQRLLGAISDPFTLGWDLFGTASYEPDRAWMQSSMIWSLQVLAVISGHVIGAWAGHVVAPQSTPRLRTHRLRQIPLAIVMVVLTTTTLWSLGQATTDPTAARPAQLAEPPIET